MYPNHVAFAALVAAAAAGFSNTTNNNGIFQLRIQSLIDAIDPVNSPQRLPLETAEGLFQTATTALPKNTQTSSDSTTGRFGMLGHPLRVQSLDPAQLESSAEPTLAQSGSWSPGSSSWAFTMGLNAAPNQGGGDTGSSEFAPTSPFPASSPAPTSSTFPASSPAPTSSPTNGPTSSTDPASTSTHGIAQKVQSEQAVLLDAVSQALPVQSSSGLTETTTTKSSKFEADAAPLSTGETTDTATTSTPTETTTGSPTSSTSIIVTPGTTSGTTIATTSDSVVASSSASDTFETLSPTTQSPTTQSPTTQSPTTQSPTTQSPTILLSLQSLSTGELPVPPAPMPVSSSESLFAPGMPPQSTPTVFPTSALPLVPTSSESSTNGVLLPKPAPVSSSSTEQSAQSPSFTTVPPLSVFPTSESVPQAPPVVLESLTHVPDTVLSLSTLSELSALETPSETSSETSSLNPPSPTFEVPSSPTASSSPTFVAPSSPTFVAPSSSTFVVPIQSSESLTQSSVASAPQVTQSSPTTVQPTTVSALPVSPSLSPSTVESVVTSETLLAPQTFLAPQTTLTPQTLLAPQNTLGLASLESSVETNVEQTPLAPKTVSAPQTFSAPQTSEVSEQTLLFTQTATSTLSPQTAPPSLSQTFVAPGTLLSSETLTLNLTPVETLSPVETLTRGQLQSTLPLVLAETPLRVSQTESSELHVPLQTPSTGPSQTQAASSDSFSEVTLGATTPPERTRADTRTVLPSSVAPADQETASVATPDGAATTETKPAPDAPKTSTKNWLPTLIVTESAVQPTGIATATVVATQTTGLPDAITPATTAAPGQDFQVVYLGFKEPLNYPFVVEHALSSAQIFEFLPGVLTYPFSGSSDYDEVAVKRLVPYTAAGVDYVITVAEVYFPIDAVGALSQLVQDLESRLYRNPDITQGKLALLVDNRIPLVGLDDLSSDGDTTMHENSGLIDGTNAPIRKKGRVAGVAVGAAVGSVIYLGLMAMLFRRFKKKKGIALPLDLESSLGTPNLTHSSGGLQISEPVNAFNSLGWTTHTQ